MTNLFVRFDSLLIDTIFQPATELIETRTGINNFFLTRIILCLITAYVTVRYINVGNPAGALITGIFNLVYAYLSLLQETSTKRRRINSFRSGLFPWFIIRIATLIGFSLSVVELTTSFSVFGSLAILPTLSPIDKVINGIGLVLSLYTLACSPLPPGLKKMEKVLAQAH